MTSIVVLKSNITTVHHNLSVLSLKDLIETSTSTSITMVVRNTITVAATVAQCVATTTGMFALDTITAEDTTVQCAVNMAG